MWCPKILWAALERPTAPAPVANNMRASRARRCSPLNASSQAQAASSRISCSHVACLCPVRHRHRAARIPPGLVHFRTTPGIAVQMGHAKRDSMSGSIWPGPSTTRHRRPTGGVVPMPVTSMLGPRCKPVVLARASSFKG